MADRAVRGGLGKEFQAEGAAVQRPRGGLEQDLIQEIKRRQQD